MSLETKIINNEKINSRGKKKTGEKNETKN